MAFCARDSDHCSCHGVSKQIQASYVMRLPCLGMIKYFVLKLILDKWDIIGQSISTCLRVVDKWQVLCSKAMGNRILRYTGNFSSACVTVRFPRRSLVRGVLYKPISSNKGRELCFLRGGRETVFYNFSERLPNFFSFWGNWWPVSYRGCPCSMPVYYYFSRFEVDTVAMEQEYSVMVLRLSAMGNMPHLLYNHLFLIN